MLKKGITVTSLVVYVVLLSSFTAIALSVSNNLSTGIFTDKGEAINLSNYDKALYYLNRSSMLSQEVNVEGNIINFSNSDVYTYNSLKSTLYFNDGVLCDNVKTFTANVSGDTLNITMELSKYNHTMQRNINLYIGE